MRLVLCDDNRILCEALAVALERRGHKVLATTITTVCGIAAVAEYQPDACLLDLKFPDPPDGLAAARLIRQRYSETAVVLLSGLIDPAIRSEAMRIGVAAFLRKDQNIDHISDALEVVVSGGVIFDSTLTGRPSPPRGWRKHSAYVLTPREKDVARRMVAGQSTAQMAHEMRVEVSTVRTYVKNVLTKLGVHSRLQAAALVTREHLLGDWTEMPSGFEPDQGRPRHSPINVGSPRTLGLLAKDAASEAGVYGNYDPHRRCRTDLRRGRSGQARRRAGYYGGGDLPPGW